MGCTFVAWGNPLYSWRHFSTVRNRRCTQPRGVATRTQHWNGAGAILREHSSVALYLVEYGVRANPIVPCCIPGVSCCTVWDVVVVTTDEIGCALSRSAARTHARMSCTFVVRGTSLHSRRHCSTVRNRRCTQPRGIATRMQYWNDASAILREHLSVAQHSIGIESVSESYCILLYS